MGTTVAEGWANAVIDGHISMETAVTQHLTYNHYPPVHPGFVPAALQAIALVKDGDTETTIELPNERVLTAGAIVEGLRLEAFVYAEPEGYSNHNEDRRTTARKQKERN